MRLLNELASLAVAAGLDLASVAGLSGSRDMNLGA